ncbi:MAG: S-layer homology domain-containing protein, partial [Oscillospiraceae bacterium]|nr:S-layer homology domain-containing protein [Oscillospiraceae bacterium]
MRTLKKTLSLVLVLAMVCSFFVMGTSAAFEDAADIDAKYEEAVAVMNGLGIIQGDGKNFNPDGTLTRAHAATFIVRILKAEGYAAACTANFTDVAEGDWYYDAVAYCQTMGY